MIQQGTNQRDTDVDLAHAINCVARFETEKRKAIEGQLFHAQEAERLDREYREAVAILEAELLPPGGPVEAAVYVDDETPRVLVMGAGLGPRVLEVAGPFDGIPF